MPVFMESRDLNLILIIQYKLIFLLYFDIWSINVLFLANIIEDIYFTSSNKMFM